MTDVSRRLLWALPFFASPLAGLQSDRDSVPDTTYVMSEMVVTAFRSARAARAASPVAATAATPSDADRAAGRVAADLLRGLPGVYVQQTSAGQGAVVLRGFVGNQVLLLVNGIPMNNGTYRDGPGQYLATIDPETIERIEVVRGPASVLYGSDAQGGVVNLITRPHPEVEGWSLRGTARASTANRGARGRLSAGYGGHAITFGVGATLQQAGDLRAGGGLGPQRPTGFTAEGVDARFTYRLNKTHRFIVGLEHFGMHDVPRYDRYVDFRAPGTGRDAEHVFDPQNRQLAFARYRAEPMRAGLVSLEVTASLAMQREGRSRRRLQDTGLPETIRTVTRDDVYTPGLSLVGSSLVPGGPATVWLTWGAEAYRDELSSRGRVESLSGTSTALVRFSPGGNIPTGRFPDGASMDRVGAFLSADAQLAKRLRLSLGGRWSGFRSVADVGAELGGAVENRASALTGQIGAVVTLAAPLSLAVRVAQGFRAPNLYDLTNVGSVPGGIVLPNPDTRPEESVSYEAGLRWLDNRTAVEFTVYRSEIEDFIDRVPGAFNGDTLFNGERVFQGLNFASARVAGVEVEAVRTQGDAEARLTLLYTHGRQRLADATTEPMAKIPPLRGTATFRWHAAAGRVTLAYDLEWAARQDRLAARDRNDPRIPTNGTPGYAVHSLTVTARLSADFSASGGLENLANSLYRAHASGVDAPGRHVWVGVTLFEIL